MSCDYTETNDTRFDFVNKENLANDRGPVLPPQRTIFKRAKLN